MEQGSDEWHEARRGKATVSMFKVLMAKRGLGAIAHTYAKEIVGHSLQDAFEENFTTFAMQLGIDLEPVAISRYEQETLEQVYPKGFITKGDFLGCSPDGLIGDVGGIEVKCPQSAKHIDNLLSVVCPKEYYDQIQGSLYITGRLWWDFVSYNPNFKTDYQIKIIRVEPDLEWVELFEERVEEFKQLINNYKQQLDGSSRKD